MKAVSEDPTPGQVSWKCIDLCNPWHVPMKAGVKTGDLFNVRIITFEYFNGFDFVGQVVWSERHQFIERLH